MIIWRLTWSLDGEIESVHGLRVELDDFNTISNQNEGRIGQILFQVHFNSNHACCDVTSNHFKTVSLDAQFDDKSKIQGIVPRMNYLERLHQDCIGHH